MQDTGSGFLLRSELSPGQIISHKNVNSEEESVTGSESEGQSKNVYLTEIPSHSRDDRGYTSLMKSW